MVLRGQFLERPCLIPVNERLVLEGMSHRGAIHPPLLVLPPAEEGGGMDHVVGAELAWAAAQAKHPSLRFNYRGVGASQGQKGDAASRLADSEAALRVLEETTGTARIAIIALGGSASVLLELLPLHPGLAGVAFVSPRGATWAPDALLQARAHSPLVIAGQLDAGSGPRPALAAAVAEAGGTLELIPGADSGFVRNLPLVGKAVVEWLDQLKS